MSTHRRPTPTRARVLFYGDDFTGASDNAAQFARHGLRTRLYFNHPGLHELQLAAQSCDVIGVAGTSRSLAPHDMSIELLPVWQDFHALGIPFVQYKCCSTFDSSPHIGSLGHAIGLMKQIWPDSFVPVHAAAPEFGRYTLFGNHFARAGDAVARLDRHPVMSVHPVTPMHESDLRKVLAEQGVDISQLIDIRRLDQHQTDPQVLASDLQTSHSAVFDGYTQQHVITVAAALWQLSQQRPVCALSAQGLAHGLGQFLRAAGLIENDMPVQQLASTDKLLVLSGSCSDMSAKQIQTAEKNGFVCIRLGHSLLLGEDELGFKTFEERVCQVLANGQSAVVYTAMGPDDAMAAQLRLQTADWHAGALAKRIGDCFARLAKLAFERTGLTRLVVAGGDSSSFTMRALGAQALQIKASHFAQNAHFCRLVSDDPLLNHKEVLLKGGQVGTQDLYSLALRGFDGHDI